MRSSAAKTRDRERLCAAGTQKEEEVGSLLVGMALMYGCELNVQNVEGGALTLKRLSNP